MEYKKETRDCVAAQWSSLQRGRKKINKSEKNTTKEEKYSKRERSEIGEKSKRKEEMDMNGETERLKAEEEW